MEKIKVITIGVFATLTSMLGALAVPVCLLVICNLIDYVTGIAASKFRNQEISSYKGIRGIVKKVSMWLLIGVGAVIDELIRYSVESVGLAIPFTFAVACVVAIWLVANEIISILENMNDIGVKLPPFLMPVVKRLKSQIEEKSKIETEEEQ